MPVELQPGLPHARLVELDDWTVAPSLGLEHLLRWMLFQVVEQRRLAVDRAKHELGSGREQADLACGLHDQPLHDEATRAGVLDREPAHAAQWLFQFEAQRPLVTDDVIGEVALQPCGADRACCAYADLRWHDCSVIALDHLVLHGLRAVSCNALPVQRGDADFDQWQARVRRRHRQRVVAGSATS